MDGAPSARPPTTTALSIAAVAFLSAAQTPLSLVSFPAQPSGSSPVNPDLTHWHLAFAALDHVDDALANGLGRAPGKEGYLGLLVVCEDLAVYGYRPSSNITILTFLRLQSQSVRDFDVLTVFHAFHQAYLLAISNPFHPSPVPSPSPPLAPPLSLPHREAAPFAQSKLLDRRLRRIVGALQLSPPKELSA